MPLTTIQIRNAKPKAAIFKLFDERGLYLQVNPSGGKLWRLKYYFAGKERLLALGSFPEVSLAQAREKRDAARSVLANGGNPAEAKQQVKQERNQKAQNTLEKLYYEWHGVNKAKWTERYADRSNLHS